MFASLFRNLIAWVVGIISYEALLEVCLFCFGFLMIGWINISSDNQTMPATPLMLSMFQRFGFEGSHTYGTEEIKSFLTKVISVLSLLGAVIHFLMYKLLKVQLKIHVWWGLGLITVFFMFSLISCFLPTAKEGAQSIVPVLVFFLLLSLFSYGRYWLFRVLGKL